MLTGSTAKKSIYFIFATIVLDMIGIGIIIPVLPDVVRRFATDPSTVTKLFGYFVALYALMQFIASPILGSLSDRFGRRPILLSSLLGASIDYVFMAFAPTLGLLFVGRLISGLTGASMTVANSYIADVSTDENRAGNFGMIGAAFGIGFIAGPLIGGLLGHYGHQYPFLAAAVLNFLNFLFGIFILPESLDEAHRRHIEWKKLNPFSSLAKILKPSPILIFIVTYTLLFLAGNVHPSIWTLYTEYKFSWTPVQVGLSLSFVGLVYGLSQAMLTKKLVPKWGEHKALMIGVAFNAIGFLLFAVATHGWMMYAVMLGCCLSGLAMPVLQSMMSREVEPNRQGELQGGLVSLSSLASIAAPLLYTSAFNLAVKPASAIPFIGLPYMVAALIVFFSAGLLAYKLKTE
jgi:DHA1 family tetracycline resistance protein-like MFS transporter